VSELKKFYIWTYIIWSIYSIGFILACIVLWIFSLKSIFVLGKQLWLEPNIIILVFEIISMFNCFGWFLHIIFIWSASVVKELKDKGRE